MRRKPNGSSSFFFVSGYFTGVARKPGPVMGNQQFTTGGSYAYLLADRDWPLADLCDGRARDISDRGDEETEESPGRTDRRAERH